MDFGYFKRSRKRFWSWIIIPPLLMCIVYGVSQTHTHLVSKELESRLKYLQLLPKMETRMEAGKDALSRFRGDAVSADRISSDINMIATETGFRIDSLLAAEPRNRVAVASSNISKLEFKIVGESSLVGYMKFLDEVKKRHQGLSVHASSLVFRSFNPQPVYKAELSLLLHKVTM